uniref:Uncharacterized protein n=1 Tax=Oncorhynchus mykiss TaxID=8022 RepID=A0A8C7TLC5_ONCMY
MWVSDNLRVLVEAEDQSTSSKKHPIRGARGGGQVASDGLLSQADDLRVQIIANKSETDRWISAFIEHKPLEINEDKVRDFCFPTRALMANLMSGKYLFILSLTLWQECCKCPPYLFLSTLLSLPQRYLHCLTSSSSLSELDGKISAVKTALLKRMGEFGLVAYVTVSPLIPNL